MVRDEALQSTTRLRTFLSSLDTASVDWISTAEKWLLKELDSYIPKPVRKATFSVGEDFDDEISESTSIRPIMVDCETQCDSEATVLPTVVVDEISEDIIKVTNDGNLDDIRQLWKEGKDVRPGDALRLLNRDFIKHRELENRFPLVDAISIRRAFLSGKNNFSLANVPFKEFDYTLVTGSMGACCENVIGCIPVPVGVAGPLKVKGLKREGTYYVPMATTEGALVASTNRGCKAIMDSGSGVTACVYDDKMTRAPVMQFPTIVEATSFKSWINEEDNFAEVKEKFESTSQFCKLRGVDVALSGDLVFLTFKAFTGDAMGMNMISKACQAALEFLREKFPYMEILALSGNVCSDKKASALNWTRGRGRSVVAQCTIKKTVVEKLFKTTPEQFAKIAHAKLDVGSSIACCIGGNNAHAANIVAAIFIATGQDAAHVISSGMCSTKFTIDDSGDLEVSCTMPVMEVGSVGGGTILSPQKGCLQMLSCAGPALQGRPGDNASTLAEIICSTVVAGELSLMAALCTDELVKSHMRLNRSSQQLYTGQKAPPMNLPAFSLSENPRQFFRTKRNSEVAQCSNIL